MIVLEYKLKGKDYQYKAINEAIRTSQFIRNKAVRYWMDNQGTSKYTLNKYCAVLAKEFPFAAELNSIGLHNLVLNVRGQQFLGSLIIVKSKLKVKKDFLSLRKTAVQWNTKPVDGNSTRKLKNILPLPIKKVLVD